MGNGLSPDYQLYVTLAALVLIPLCAGAVLIWLKRYVDKKMGEPLPLWEVALTDLKEKLTHPHEFAREMDQLMREVGPAGEVDWKKYAELKRELLERSLSTDENMREDETDAALAYLLVWKLARNEAKNPAKLTGVRLVGTHAVENQTLIDKVKGIVLIPLVLVLLGSSVQAQDCTQAETKAAQFAAQLAAEKALTESLRAVRDKLQQDLVVAKNEAAKQQPERIKEIIVRDEVEISRLRTEIARLTKQRDKAQTWKTSFLRVFGKKAKK